MSFKIAIGCELPKDRWLLAAEDIKQIAPSIAQRLQTTNCDGMGKQDAKDFMNDIMLACTALQYVANCATDKCRFIPMPDEKESKS